MITVVNLRVCKDFGTREGDVRIDRRTKWGNPFKITKSCTREQCLKKYEYYFVHNLLKDIDELKSARRMGCWCFGKGSLVTTLRGFVPIEDVVVGDMVFSHDSHYHRVARVMKTINAPTVKIKFQGIPEPLICTPDHEFYTCRRVRVQSNYKREIVSYQPTWIPAEKLRKRMNTSHSCGNVVGFPKDVVVSQDNHTTGFWYLVGRYLGDGWLVSYDRPSGYIRKDNTQSNKMVWLTGICTSHQDANFLSQKITEAGFKSNRTEMKTETTFRICNKELTTFLTQFGKYSHGKYIPEWCFSLSRDKQKSLLQGIVDSDGYLERKRQRITISTVSKTLAFGVARLSRNVNGSPVSICKKQIPKKPSVILDRKIIAKYPTFCISWTIGDIISRDNMVWMPFRSISSGEIVDVYNLSVEETESYVVNGIAVHNCKPLACHGDVIRKYLEKL